MKAQIKHLVVVGGGTAGWITAGILAADRSNTSADEFQITVIESPDVSPIGVGEGTWPSMRSTLKRIGVSETDFIRECCVSFKQGSKFTGWINGGDESYYHPFSLPQGYDDINLAQYWQVAKQKTSFAHAVSAQAYLCDNQLAPKQITTPEYAFMANYGYHLDSVKFSAFLQKHCTEKLGVKHILANVEKVNVKEDGDIRALTLSSYGEIEGDLFVDCTGFSSLLIGKHFDIPFISKRNILFNDTAIAAQVPYAMADDPIASATLSSAKKAGWIWDIGLPTRKGVGYVFSSAHTSKDEAEQQLINYIAKSLGEKKAQALDFRQLNINPGYREKFWHKNCVAIGLAAGFIEPLEASALVLIELSAAMLSEQLPANREVMDIVGKRFNTKFLHHWQNIIDFLKLHYVLTQRKDSDYWRDNCEASSIPDSLQEQIALWQYQGPWHQDSQRVDDMFPPASFQYIVHGMGFTPQLASNRSQFKDNDAQAMQQFQHNSKKIDQLMQVLPSNRVLLEKIHSYGLAKI